MMILKKVLWLLLLVPLVCVSLVREEEIKISTEIKAGDLTAIKSGTTVNSQKQPLADVLQNRCS